MKKYINKRQKSWLRTIKYFYEHDAGDGVMIYCASFGFPCFEGDECTGLELPLDEEGWWYLTKRYCFDLEIDLEDYLYAKMEGRDKLAMHLVKIIDRKDNNNEKCNSKII